MSHQFSISDVLGLFQNPVFLSAIFSWFVSQGIKTVVTVGRRRCKNFFDAMEVFFWRTGSMPSSHSALATSLATSMAIHVGLNSELFVLACFFALVTIRDALGVRRASGIQAEALNDLGEAVSQTSDISFKPVKEVHGHTAIEVMVGMLVGVVASIIFTFIYG